MKHSSIIIPGLISFFMLIIAIPEGLPYDYYIILRWIICASSLYFVWYIYENKKNGWIWPMGIIGILFNPLIPVYLNKSIWIFIDLISAILFLSCIFLIKTKENA